MREYPLDGGHRHGQRRIALADKKEGDARRTVQGSASVAEVPAASEGSAAHGDSGMTNEERQAWVRALREELAQARAARGGK